MLDARLERTIGGTLAFYEPPTSSVLKVTRRIGPTASTHYFCGTIEHRGSDDAFTSCHQRSAGGK